MTDERKREQEAEIARGVRVVRVGHGANCSSIGSVIDTLFASAVVGSAILTAVAAAMAKEAPTVGAPKTTGDAAKEADREESP